MALNYLKTLTAGAMLLAGSRVSAGAQASPAGPTAGQRYKNVQVLKDVPASDWIPMMQFISGSLGVTCDFCHTLGKFDSDSKKTKRTAREMIRMVLAIDSDHFDGKLAVTCNTCHQGTIHPNGVPHLWDKTAEQLAAYRAEVQAVADSSRPEARAAVAQSAPPPGLPSEAEIFAAYRAAVGAEHVRTLHLAGRTHTEEADQNIDVTFSFPDKILIRGNQGGRPAQEIVNGEQGWLVTPQGRRPLTPAQVAAVWSSVQIYVPVKFSNDVAAMRLVGVDTVDGRRCYVLERDGPKLVQTLYFEIASGLLYEEREETQTPLGTRVEDQHYTDYRDVGGAKLPFSIVQGFMEDRFERTITEATPNIAVDSSVFGGGGDRRPTSF